MNPICVMPVDDEEVVEKVSPCGAGTRYTGQVVPGGAVFRCSNSHQFVVELERNKS